MAGTSYTPIEQIPKIIGALRDNFNTGKHLSILIVCLLITK